MTSNEAPTDVHLARRRAAYLIGLLWHLGVFMILNGFFLLLDLYVGQDGAQWAYWIAAVWGLALLFHVLAWLIDGRQLERRIADRYLAGDRHAAH